MNTKKPNVNRKDYVCPDCGQSFAHNSSRSRHQKYRCKSLKIDIPPGQKKKIDNQQSENHSDVLTLLESKISDITDSNIGDQPRPNLLSVIQQQSKNIQQQNEKIDKLTKMVQGKNQEQINIEQQQNITNNNNNQYVTIYVTEKVDFIEILTNRFGGDRQKAISYLKEKINKKVDGDVDLFCDIYLNGPKETWSCICQDKKNFVFQLRDANNNVINDPGGVQLYKNFRMNYINALLYLSSLELKRVIDFKVGTDEFAERRDYLMDEFDIGLVQNKMFGLSQGNPDPFIKRVVKRIDMLEKAFELAFHNVFPQNGMMQFQSLASQLVASIK